MVPALFTHNAALRHESHVHGLRSQHGRVSLPPPQEVSDKEIEPEAPNPQVPQAKEPDGLLPAQPLRSEQPSARQLPPLGRDTRASGGEGAPNHGEPIAQGAPGEAGRNGRAGQVRKRLRYVIIELHTDGTWTVLSRHASYEQARQAESKLSFNRMTTIMEHDPETGYQET